MSKYLYKVAIILLIFSCASLRVVAQWQSWTNQDRPIKGKNETSSQEKGPIRTRSLSGGKATDGDAATAATIVGLMRVGLIEGYAVRRIKMFNNRIYLDRYRRSYWLGTRYYALDNNYFFETRDTCIYRMNNSERADLEYEDGEEILDVVYQCQRYAQYCCGLDCCENMNEKW